MPYNDKNKEKAPKGKDSKKPFKPFTKKPFPKKKKK